MFAVWIWYGRKLPEVDVIPHSSICLWATSGVADKNDDKEKDESYHYHDY